ncbi:uncharacterized protein LOC9658490 [Selaginella moellendorffii]|uniref:uncharacterized protein LOC9658490 n=1 Tax=Selaginella moellendorffii TaxID=88036 RepID=UPI000D1C6867|nr:uncharacterized protein LOC9658490 [Selaginella moellendorffii]|eukprot:XP_002964782.2 uncharacterized protein LOC9658490 [Selaginella moellendorffii]
MAHSLRLIARRGAQCRGRTNALGSGGAGSLLRRDFHVSAPSSNNFLLNSLFRFGGQSYQQQQQQQQQAAAEAPPPKEERRARKPREYMERSADTLSYVKDLNIKQRLMVKKFMNSCMRQGKKTKARTMCFKAFERLANHGDVLHILETAVENVKPICEVRRVRVAGSTHNVPAAIPLHRQQSLSMRWIVQAARNRFKAKKKMGMPKALADELLDASKRSGAARKKRDDLHRLAEANRTLAHYRWW